MEELAALSSQLFVEMRLSLNLQTVLALEAAEAAANWVDSFSKVASLAARVASQSALMGQTAQQWCVAAESKCCPWTLLAIVELDSQL